MSDIHITKANYQVSISNLLTNWHRFTDTVNYSLNIFFLPGFQDMVGYLFPASAPLVTAYQRLFIPPHLPKL